MSKKSILVLGSFWLAASSAFAQQAPSGYVSLDAYQPPAARTAVTKPQAVSFEVMRGASLRATLEQWTNAAGWQPLTWNLPDDTDFTLGASAKFEGDFVSAMRSLMNALSPEAQIRVRFVHANRLVIVEPLQ